MLFLIFGLAEQYYSEYFLFRFYWKSGRTSILRITRLFLEMVMITCTNNNSRTLWSALLKK